MLQAKPPTRKQPQQSQPLTAFRLNVAAVKARFRENVQKYRIEQYQREAVKR